MNTQHTKGPQPVLAHTTDGGAIYLTDNHDFTKARFAYRVDNGILTGEEAANLAALIVKAVNSHGALIAACNAALSHIEAQWKVGVGVGNGARDLLASLRGALALAGE